MTNTLYQKAKELLYAEYNRNFAMIKDEPFYAGFATEKLQHSLQVSGAGNGILQNEPYFAARSADFIDIAKTAILLHDIFRFSEIAIYAQTKHRVDHSLEGGKFLQNTADFNDERIVLPVKHHGHMPKDFYEDTVYLAIKDENLNHDIEHIWFAVRDADKIANWNLLASDFDYLKQFWLSHATDTSPEQAKISPEVWQVFANEQIIPRAILKTNADELLGNFSWLFDMNYAYCIKYCSKLNLFAKYKIMFKKLNIADDVVEQIMQLAKNYINKKFGS